MQLPILSWYCFLEHLFPRPVNPRLTKTPTIVVSDAALAFYRPYLISP